jgi:UDPglucose 6-dehydrogenase/GDP-mannose 6-dehydrogenase
MKISVIGLGYVGLVTSTCLAEAKHQVIGVDSNREKLQKISEGQVPFFEPGLESLLHSLLKKKLFRVTHDLNQAIKETEVTFVCVDTPCDAEGNIDLTSIKKAVREIGEALKDKSSYHLVVIKSTVVPTTTMQVILPILKEASNKDTDSFGLAVNPEFLREGKAVADFRQQDRIVIGAIDQRSVNLLEKVYTGFKSPKLKVRPNTAEMIKYVNNALLANLISFSNEVANIAELIPDIELDDVFKGIYLDKRWQWCLGKDPSILVYLKPGAGFGGSCLPKDTSALARFTEKKGYQPRLINAVLTINKERLNHIIAILETRQKLGCRQVSVLGLTFNPDTSDIRESPALSLIKKLLDMGMQVRAYDPFVKHMEAPGVGFQLCQSLEEAIKDSEAAVVMTAWKEFSDFPPGRWKELMAIPFLLDCRRFLNVDSLKKAGVDYLGIGDYYPR